MNKCLLLSLFLSFLLPSAVLAQSEEVVLDNGLRLVIREDQTHPVVGIHAYVETGSSFEGDYLGSGISHYVEHMLFKGTETRAVGEIAREVEGLGGSFNASTGLDATRYSIVLPSRHVHQAIEIMADALFHSSFVESEMEKEGNVILGEMRLNRDNPARSLYRIFWDTAYIKHPYRYPVIGYEDVFLSLTREDLLSYYWERYVPDNIVLAVVGDVDSYEVQESVEEYFGTEPRRVPSEIPQHEEPLQLSERYREVWLPIHEIHLMIGYHGPPLNHPDLYAMDVLAILLGQGKSSRLVHMLKDTEELALSVSAASYTPSAPGLFLINADIEPDLEKLDRFLARVDQEIDRISIEGPLPEELKKAKAQVVSRYLYEQQDVRGKAGDLASSLALTGDLDFSKRYVEGIRQVTDEDVRNVLFHYFGENRRTVVTLLPKELRGEKPSEGIIEAGELHWSMQPNGFRLITRRVSDLPIVTLNLVLKGGTSYEPRPGLSLFMSRLLTKGTQHQDAFELARSVESVGASWQSYSANNSFGLSISGLAEHLPDLMRVLAEAITDSVFPRAEVDKARRIMLASLDAEDDDVFRVAGRLLRAELFKKSPFRHPPSGTRESIERIKREDLTRFHRRFMIPANMVLSVIGDIDEEEVQQLADYYFGKLDARPLPKLHKIRLSKDRTYDPIERIMPHKEQTLVLIGFPAEVTVDHPDRFTFSVLNKMLSGQGGRLFRRIRDDLGLAYTLGAYQVLGLGASYEVLYVATTRANATLVQELIQEELIRLKVGEIDLEELDKAKTALIGTHEMSLQTIGAVANQTALDELYDIGFSAYKLYPEEIKLVSPENIQRVADEYFRKEFGRVVVVGPPDE